MDYNTSRTKLILPEYGRNIQKLVEQLKEIEDRTERTRYAHSIINVMGNMNPHLRDINDFKHKLWDHLSIMSNFELEIDAPYPLPGRTDFETKPNKIPYNTNQIQFKHYGKIIEQIIMKAQQMEGEEKEALIKIIANQMKKSYLTWNKEIVNDEIIFNAIKEISDGAIDLEDNPRLTETKEILQRNKRKRTKKIDNIERNINRY